MPLCLAWEEAKSTLGHFCPVSSYMNWKAKSRFNASFLRLGTKSLFVPQWNLSLKSCTTSCEIQTADVPWESRLAVLPSLKVQEWALCIARLKMTLSALIPIGVPKWTKLPAKGRGCGQWMCVWFCFVPLWICLVIYRAKGKSKGAECSTVFCKLYSMEPFQGLETLKAGSRGQDGWKGRQSSKYYICLLLPQLTPPAITITAVLLLTI